MITNQYPIFLADLKTRIRQAQLKAAVSVNRELILLYWNVGKDILTNQEKLGWGAKVIDQLSQDLRKEFPDMKGFSVRNLKYMQAFAATYPDPEFVQQVAAQLPWFHICLLITRIKDPDTRIFYIKKAIEHGWSRNILVHQIESGLHLREGASTTNFALTLPPIQSDLAHQTLKDPYIFDFLTLSEEAQEKDLEDGLTSHIQQFLLELGIGFAFLGRQYPLTVGDQDFYLDLLFYHTRLHCYVVIELKAHEFKPEYAGKLNFYLSAVDDLIRQDGDNPTIGLLLCREKNRAIAEYALRDIQKPIGVSEYQLTRALSEDLKERLPSVEEIEKTLEEIELKTVSSMSGEIEITYKDGTKYHEKF
ncbi:PDDEXK nuclease domain-containing protein [uncultured Methanospirillum sp.]|uniref:PDDEXK nuclease domain-containing protein n=1 Tax=uncultured Methanospirillum sp. TaxID=262503 RepID=UPI0029C66A33|nr:PDDEXK nuclease domain-containing protein [uncultured Methanospirillum sp.]